MSTKRNVVIAMDGSEHSSYAFDWYMRNIHRPNDHVILVHCPEYHPIIQSPMPGNAEIAAQRIAKEEERIKALAASLEEKLKAAGIGGTVKSIPGSPGDVVIRAAEDADASFIVTGTRGLGKIRRTFVGSVSDYIMHHSHIPVLVCRHKNCVTLHND